MGYTNYWHWDAPIADADTFAAWSKDVRQLLEYLTEPGKEFPDHLRFFGQEIQNSKDPIFCGPDGTGDPIITSEVVAFNGNASLEQDYEAFVIGFTDLQEPLPFAFCKTAAKPYDILVICSLVRLSHYFQDVVLWSDGEEQAIDLGVKVCRDVFGENKYPQLG